MSYEKVTKSYEKLQKVTFELRKSYEKLQKVMKNYKRETRNDPDKDPAAFVEWAKGETNLNYAAALAR